MPRFDTFPDVFTGYLSTDITHPDGPTIQVSYITSAQPGSHYLGSPDRITSDMAAVDIRKADGTPITQRVLSQLPPQVLEGVIGMMIRHDPAEAISRIISKNMAMPDGEPATTP